MFRIRRSTSLFLLVIVSAALPLRAIAEPSITIDVQSGAVLSSEDAFRRWSPASLTKLMTAYITFSDIAAGKLEASAPVRISNNAANNPPAKMGYPVGAVMRVDSALRMLIIKSANDIAVAIAEAVAGSESAFVDRMNAEAKRLGMTGTQFSNPNGLTADGQYSNARDLGLLARAIRKDFPQYDPVFAAEAIVTGDSKTPSYNLLLGRFEGADGMKTGYVCASGFNMVASATRNGRTVVTVVLGAASQKARAERAANNLETGFRTMATGAPALTIENFRPDAAMANQTVADMTSQICTEEALANRWDGRQIEGYITFDTPLIGKLEREPNAISAGLGGADGASKAAVMINGSVIAGYPVPAPKPLRPTVLEDGDLEKFGLRPGFDVPVPDSRPQG